ncbi:N-hydroxyarylamine O-acetyltransferase [Nocardiopsis mwathae]|uniref:N-hydroxyarylamine O-acetyltransferase n=1 Tax=Nocardiopsis mwathae TaxID=1472723 RepID=A0A7X0D405_9ACTN|nr:arylamine N-acetyltransferase [Nocardiopsis mwathae]MBB6170555.1 N-hydroxyarylamine O-acetyltransferase [Nocardiopsis mwathae]
MTAQTPGHTAAGTTTADPARAWQGDALDLDAYLARVGYDGDRGPTLDTLRALHRAHLAAFPFENLDIVLGRPIRLDIGHLVEKLVHGRRGGYCYEHNHLFAAVLERLGFTFTGVAARVQMGTDKLRPATHMALIVTIDGTDHLADVGFGDEGLLEPLPFADGSQARQSGATFRIERRGGEWVLRSLHTDGWFDIYRFTTAPQHTLDYEIYNHYLQTHERSPFMGRIIAQKTSPELRHSLIDTTLTTTRHGGTAHERLLDPEEVPPTLRTVFGIGLAPEESSTVTTRVRAFIAE